MIAWLKKDNRWLPVSIFFVAMAGLGILVGLGIYQFASIRAEARIADATPPAAETEIARQYEGDASGKTQTPSVEPNEAPTGPIMGQRMGETDEVTGTAEITETAEAAGWVPGWNVDWYRSPFVADEYPEDEAAADVFAEPGVLLDETAAFDYLSAAETPLLAPEGAWNYFATGAITITYRGQSIALPHQDRNIYLGFLQGLPSDGDPGTDLNQIVLARGYVRAAGIYSEMPAGSYISVGWLRQQIEGGFSSDPNCGADGCRTVTIVVLDLETMSYRMWTVSDSANPLDWVRVGSN